MKNILIIGDNIQEINKLRRVFGMEFKVSATNSAESALEILQSKAADLAVFRAGTDLGAIFDFYKSLRRKISMNLPLLIIAPPDAAAILADTVEMNNAAVVEATVPEARILDVISSILGES